MIKNNVLIADDIEKNRRELRELFSNDYEILEADSGDAAMQMIESYSSQLAVVLLDAVLPDKGGYDVLDFMRFNRYLDDIPVIMISDAKVDSDIAEIEGLKRGASDFIREPFNTNIIKQRVRNVIELFRYKRSLERIIAEQTDKFMGITEFVIDVLVNVMEVKSKDTRQSMQRIRVYTRELLNFVYEYSDEKYGLNQQKISLISAASILHNIGMLVVSEDLAGKGSLLSDEDQEKLKEHTTRGCEIIESMGNAENREFIDMAVEICRYHHERWDGSGYPDHLVGDEIPISAQVVGLADTYNELRTGELTGREYNHEEAMNAILRGNFGAFSPVLTESCKILESRFNEIFSQGE